MVKDNLAHQIVATPKDEIVIDEIPVKWCTVSLSEIIERGMRLEASVYDVEAKQARETITNGKYPLTTLGGADGMTTSYTGARFKRIWVEKSDYPIYQPSSIMDIKPSPDGYISAATDTDIDALRVSKGQVLMTCSGTIGKVSYVSDTLDNMIFSHDLLRINCKRSSDAGFVYAYLKSKVGNRILLTNSYGAVITHIEPEHLATVPIPDAPDTLKLKIGNLVIRSYALRDESNNLIDEATKLLIDELHLPAIDDFSVNYFKKDASVDTFNVKLSDMGYRLDASYHVPLVDECSRAHGKTKTAITVKTTGVSVFCFEQDGYDIDVLRQQSGFIGLTQRQKEQCEECYRELTPYRITSVLESGQATKQIGAYNFVNDAEKISEAIVIILYMLRCCLAHGDISPDESANEVYKYAYEVLCAPLRKLK